MRGQPSVRSSSPGATEGRTWVCGRAGLRTASAGGRLGPRHEKDRPDQERETKGQNGGNREIEGYRQFMGGGLPPSLQVSGRGRRMGGRVGVIKEGSHKDGDWCPGEAHGATEMGHAENQRNAQGCVQHLQGPGVVRESCRGGKEALHPRNTRYGMATETLSWGEEGWGCSVTGKGGVLWALTPRRESLQQL